MCNHLVAWKLRDLVAERLVQAVPEVLQEVIELVLKLLDRQKDIGSRVLGSSTDPAEAVEIVRLAQRVEEFVTDGPEMFDQFVVAIEPFFERPESGFGVIARDPAIVLDPGVEQAHVDFPRRPRGPSKHPAVRFVLLHSLVEEHLVEHTVRTVSIGPVRHPQRHARNVKVVHVAECDHAHRLDQQTPMPSQLHISSQQGPVRPHWLALDCFDRPTACGAVNS